MANEGGGGGFQETILYPADFLVAYQVPSPPIVHGSQPVYPDIIFVPPVPRLSDWRGDVHKPVFAPASGQFTGGFSENPPTLFLNVSC